MNVDRYIDQSLKINFMVFNMLVLSAEFTSLAKDSGHARSCCFC